MYIKKLTAVILVLSFIVLPFQNVFATGKVFLLNPDPVTSAMGDSGVALMSSYATGANINPASTVGVYRTVATLAVSNITGNIQYDYGSIAFLSSIGVFCAGVMYVDYQTGDYLDNVGNVINDLGPTYDISAVLTYSFPLKRFLPTFIDYGGFGASLKFIRSSLADYISEAVAFDFGGLFAVPMVEHLSFGFAFKNFGTNQKYVKENFNLPQMFTLGLGFTYEDFYNAKIALDFNNMKDYENFTSIGLSFNPVYFLAFRFGLKLGGDSIFNNTRFGVGLQFKGVNFDYAFIPTSDLNATHQFSLSAAFGNFSDQKRAYEYYLDNHFREAEASFFAKDFVKAREQFDDILAVYPDHAPSQEYLRKTIDELAKIDDYNLDKISRYMKKADKALKKNDVVTADKYYRKALDLDPTNKTAKYGIEKGEVATHNVKVEQERAENSERIEYLWSRYEKFYKKGDLVRARDSLKYLLDIDSENALANEKIVNLDNQLAKVASDKASEIYNQGMKYYKDGEYDEAIKYFEAVIVAAPHRLDVQELIEKAQKNIQEIAEAERLSALEEEQNKVRGQLYEAYNAGLKYYQKGKLENAVKSFEKAKTIAEKYEFEEYYKNARNYISKISANLSERFYKQGFAAFRKNDFEGAASLYKKSLEYNPGNTSAKFELDRVADQVAQSFYEKGMTAYSKNEMEKAREYFRKSLYYRPNKIEAQRALERVR
ncbi:tetratricopeptide repeat protein [Candidatus Ruminimicrobiellum ovillum]|uniref:tetratricopeptide repeat protein n=1 Tax=Candidatus Ruminimicrobiellum ovillum TaxID=1947927 RepID=UPI0035598ADC